MKKKNKKRFEDYAYFKIKEAEDNLKNGGKLYSEEEVYKKLDDIIKNCKSKRLNNK